MITVAIFAVIGWATLVLIYVARASHHAAETARILGEMRGNNGSR